MQRAQTGTTTGTSTDKAEATNFASANRKYREQTETTTTTSSETEATTVARSSTRGYKSDKAAAKHISRQRGLGE
jgi:hypothetical protein